MFLKNVLQHKKISYIHNDDNFIPRPSRDTQALCIDNSGGHEIQIFRLSEYLDIRIRI